VDKQAQGLVQLKIMAVAVVYGAEVAPLVIQEMVVMAVLVI
jgi:hypothetical protein